MHKPARSGLMQCAKSACPWAPVCHCDSALRPVPGLLGNCGRAPPAPAAGGGRPVPGAIGAGQGGARSAGPSCRSGRWPAARDHPNPSGRLPRADPVPLLRIPFLRTQPACAAQQNHLAQFLGFMHLGPDMAVTNPGTARRVACRDAIAPGRARPSKGRDSPARPCAV